MLLLVYALMKAPEAGWGTTRTIGLLGTAGILLDRLPAQRARSRNPLVPLSIFQVKGLAAADATQLMAFAGFYSMFFFLTLYMQNVLGYSPIKAAPPTCP